MDGLYSPSSSDEVVKFKGTQVRSAFFKEHVKAAAYLCHVTAYYIMLPIMLPSLAELPGVNPMDPLPQTHKNATACQLLGNLCALSLHDKTQSACALIFDLTVRRGLRHLPQLYFPDRMTSSIGNEEEITNVYSVRGENSRLNITAAKVRGGGKSLSYSTTNRLMKPVSTPCVASCSPSRRWTG